MFSIRETCNPEDPAWLELRVEFFPEEKPGEHRDFLRDMARGSGGFTAFIAEDEQSSALGFAEVAVRHEYVNGCTRRPALFLEGLYIRPSHRGLGLAKKLCQAAAEFGKQHGCHEFASDVLVDNIDSLAAHVAMGFEETERVVYFRKVLGHSTESSGES